MMFTRILVPLDGSDRAEQAIPVAARIARASNGTLLLVQVATHPSDLHAAQKPAETYSGNLIAEGHALTANYLDNVSKRPELADVKIENRVVYGDVAPSILTEIESLAVDLIVLSRHGNTGLKRWALGSIAQKIVLHCAVPVLVLRDGDSVLEKEPVYALAALDGSPLAESVVPPVIQLLAALAPFAPKTLHLVRVVDLAMATGKFVMNAPFAQLREEDKLEATAYLTAVAERIADDDTIADLTVTTSIAVNPDVAEALIQSTEQEVHGSGRFNLIALATHGRGGPQRWMMGSVTERVLHHTQLPLLIVHLPKALRAHSDEQGATETPEVKEQTWAALL